MSDQLLKPCEVCGTTPPINVYQHMADVPTEVVIGCSATRKVKIIGNGEVAALIDAAAIAWNRINE